MVKDYYVAEYSVEQNCFHIENISALLKENMIHAVNKGTQEWILLGIFETDLGANEFIEKIRPKIQGKEYAAKFK